MATTSRIQNKGQVTIPTHLREQVGLAKGDLVEFSLQGGKIVITPRPVADRSQFLNADDEYTPEQRRTIDARLAEADQDIKAGRLSPVFSAPDDLIAHLHKAARKPEPTRKSRLLVR